MEGLGFTMRAVCLSVVAVSLAVGTVAGAFGQTPLPTPAVQRFLTTALRAGST